MDLNAIKRVFVGTPLYESDTNEGEACIMYILENTQVNRVSVGIRNRLSARGHRGGRMEYRRRNFANGVAFGYEWYWGVDDSGPSGCNITRFNTPLGAP